MKITQNSALRIALLVPVVFALGASTALANEVDKIIQKHIDAKGGRANWDKVQSMHITGEFTAFSKVSPFELHRKRDRLYHLDHTMNDRRIVVGYDGKNRWWDNEFGSGGPQPMTNPVDLAALERELDFATPLFDYKTRGFEVTLLEDKTEIEGIPAIALQLKRADESLETWYLDPESHLEVARESPGSDFGQPRPSRTFFDDFREIEGVKLPYHVETQWYTRDRVMNVAEIQLNTEIDDSMFALPVATGMELLQKMVGEWEVKVESKQSPRQPEFTESQRQSVITASLNGGMVEERYTGGTGTEAWRALSYDRYREYYTLTQMNNIQTYLDIQTGALDDGTLTVSNVDTGTSFTTFGATVHERCTLSNFTNDGFTLQRENSSDGGENWGVIQKLTYTRKGAQISAE